MKLKQKIIDFIGIILFYSLIIGGVILLNARMEQIQNQEQNYSTKIC